MRRRLSLAIPIAAATTDICFLKNTTRFARISRTVAYPSIRALDYSLIYIYFKYKEMHNIV